MRYLKIVKKILVPAGILIVVFVVTGMVYALIAGQSDKTPAAKPAKNQNAAEIGNIKPTKPGPNAPEGVAAYLFEPSVKAGSNAGVTARTNAGSACTISVTYNGAISADSGLQPKKADDYGTVSWTWTVPPTTPAGTWPVKITCVYNGRSGVSIADLAVVR